MSVPCLICGDFRCHKDDCRSCSCVMRLLADVALAICYESTRNSPSLCQRLSLKTCFHHLTWKEPSSDLSAAWTSSSEQPEVKTMSTIRQYTEWSSTGQQCWLPICTCTRRLLHISPYSIQTTETSKPQLHTQTQGVTFKHGLHMPIMVWSAKWKVCFIGRQNSWHNITPTLVEVDQQWLPYFSFALVCDHYAENLGAFHIMELVRNARSWLYVSL